MPNDARDLKSWRARAQLSQRAASAIFRCDVRSWQRYESGSYTIPPMLWFAIGLADWRTYRPLPHSLDAVPRANNGARDPVLHSFIHSEG